MKRILTIIKKTNKRLISPFVFPDDEAIRRCNRMNTYGREATHIPIEAEDAYPEVDVWNPEWNLYEVKARLR